MLFEAFKFNIGGMSSIHACLEIHIRVKFMSSYHHWLYNALDNIIIVANGRVIWGSLHGLKVTGEGWAEQLNPHGHGFIVEGGNVFQCARVRPGTNSEFFEEIWTMVACNGLAHLDQALFVFQQHKLPSSEVLLNIWFELVSWRRGWYNSIQGESDEAKRAREKFMLKWGRCPMVVRSSSRPKWNYQSPRWLFPPMASNNDREL